MLHRIYYTQDMFLFDAFLTSNCCLAGAALNETRNLDTTNSVKHTNEFREMIRLRSD